MSRTDLQYVNAELWGSWWSGAVVDDAAYTFALVMDTMGKRVSALRRRGSCNLHRAHTLYASSSSRPGRWTPSLPVGRIPSDVFGEALTIAQESNSLLLEDLFHGATIEYSGVRLKDSPDLLTEALAASLLLPFKSFDRVVGGNSTQNWLS